MTPANLEDRLVAALDATRRFTPLPEKGGGKPDSYRCHAEVAFTRESDEAGGAGGDGGAALRRAQVGVAVELSRPGRDSETTRAVADGSRIFDPSSRNARAAAFRGALDMALARAASSLLLDLDADRKTDGNLIADLSSPDGGVRDCAVRKLTDRKNPAAVPALIARLKDPDRQVVMRTIGALDALHDRRAVKPLIDLTDRQDPEFVAQVLYVIGAIGGSDAEAFLFTEENGSPDPRVRAAAAEAAADLRRHRASADGGVVQANRE